MTDPPDILARRRERAELEVVRLTNLVIEHRRRTRRARIYLELMREQANRHPLVIVEVSRAVIDDLLRALQEPS